MMNTKQSGHKKNIINGLLTVKQTQKLSKNFIRIIFSCNKTLNINPLWIGPHVKLLFPTDNNEEIVFPTLNEDNKIIWQEGGREKVRTYSVRKYQSVENLLTIDFVIHQKGTATTWAQQAKIGDVIGLLGMGSKVRFDQNIQLILLGDISATPAINYTLENLPANQKAIAIIEVRDESDKQVLNLPSSVKVEWLVTPQEKASQITQKLSELNLPTDSELLFWGGMESSISQNIRRVIKEQSSLTNYAIQIISYWREGFAEGEFKHHD